MIALLKLQATETFAFCAAEAAQIFGKLKVQDLSEVGVVGSKIDGEFYRWTFVH